MLRGDLGLTIQVLALIVAIERGAVYVIKAYQGIRPKATAATQPVATVTAPTGSSAGTK